MFGSVLEGLQLWFAVRNLEVVEAHATVQDGAFIAGLLVPWV